MPVMNHVFQQRLGARAYELLTRQRLWQDAIGRLLELAHPLPPAPRVLDLGCAYGVSTRALAERLPAGATVTGVDLSGPMIARARALAAAEPAPPGVELGFEQADATALPWPDASVDLVTGHSFLYLVPDRPAVLREIRRVLVPGGRLVLMEPSRDGSLAAAALRGRRALPAAGAGALDTARFATAMALWRVASRLHGRLGAADAAALFADAGLEPVLHRPALGGLGLHLVAIAPGPPAGAPPAGRGV